LSDLFEGALTRHVVLIVKGFFRRANLIPNEWKLRIGATHELYTSLVDNNAQIQALPGRMTGYWRGAIESGHKTGPHRTSVKAVEEYDAVYNDPFGVNSYQAAGFKKSNGRITTITPTFVTPRNISGLDTIALPGLEVQVVAREPIINKFRTQEEAKDYYNRELKERMNGRGPNKVKPNEDGYYTATIRSNKKICNCDEITSERKFGLTESTYRFYPCYEDVSDKSTLQWWLIHY
jgi:hypothetical protein